MRLASLGLLALSMLAGCPRSGAPDGGLDAGQEDVPRFDAGPEDAPRLDAPADAPADTRRDAPDVSVLVEAGPIDGGPPDAGPRDGGLRDAGTGAGAPDAPEPGGSTVVQCAPMVPTGATAGMACSPLFWPGFQFQITADAHLIGVGAQGRTDDPVAGSVHASVLRIPGPGVTPMLDDPGSLVTRTLITLPASTAGVGTASVDVILTPGWYVLVLGTGAHGATATAANLPSNGPAGCTSSPGSGFPFTVRRSDEMYILQGAAPHLFVVLE